MDLVRIITAGSVDDGKSTLIGRLFYDAKQLLADQVSALEFASKGKGRSYLDFSLLTDGLKEEREKGITIDVAYRYLTTAYRKYILADTPGHVEYTRNFVTACSNSEIALLMVDAGNGVLEQTRRHTYIASMMGLSKIVFCINKMDVVGYNEETFNIICKDIQSILDSTSFQEVVFIPVSALHGDNIVSRSENMNWYKGEALLEYLDSTDIPAAKGDIGVMPVQTIIKTTMADNAQGYSAYAGRITSGNFNTGDLVVIFPGEASAEIKAINKCGVDVDAADYGASVSIVLSKELDISRGDTIVHKSNDMCRSVNVRVMMCWLDMKPMEIDKEYIVRHATNELTGIVTHVDYKVNVNDFSRDKSNNQVEMNNIACIDLQLSSELFYRSYKSNKKSGAIILIDPETANTAAACTIV